MANEIQRITFPGWLGAGGGIWLSFDATPYGGWAGDFGNYAAWDGVTPSEFANDVNTYCYISFGFGNVRCTLYQATEPVILQFEFKNTEVEGFGAPNLSNTNVSELVIEHWYAGSMGPEYEPTLATITEGSLDATIVGSGGVRAGGIGSKICNYIAAPTGGAVAGGASVQKLKVGITGGCAIGGESGLGFRPFVSGGVVTGGIGSRTLQAFKVGSGGLEISNAPYSTGYFYRQTITIPAGKVNADLVDFPLPVRIQADPSLVTSNLIFTDASDNRLRHQLLNIVNGKVFAYVKTNIAANSDTVLRMYYGPA